MLFLEAWASVFQNLIETWKQQTGCFIASTFCGEKNGRPFCSSCVFFYFFWWGDPPQTSCWLTGLQLRPCGDSIALPETNMTEKKKEIHLGVSKNNGTPKSSILIGFSIINHPFWDTPILGNHHLPTTTINFQGLHPWSLASRPWTIGGFSRGSFPLGRVC